MQSIPDGGLALRVGIARSRPPADPAAGPARGRTVARLATGLVVTALVSSCGFGVTGLAFQQDDRLTIVTPREREVVTLPLRVAWSHEGLELSEPTRAGGRPAFFGIFVDRAPVPPGETVRYVARNDERCRESDGCPDEDYLASRGVFTTRDSTYTLDTLLQTAREGRREFHTVTIVLLDGHGRRIGESAWDVRFEFDRRSSL